MLPQRLVFFLALTLNPSLSPSNQLFSVIPLRLLFHVRLSVAFLSHLLHTPNCVYSRTQFSNPWAAVIQLLQRSARNTGSDRFVAVHCGQSQFSEPSVT